VSASGERGVALLTVLLLVAVMTLLLVAVLDDIRFGLRRAGNAQAVAQAQWHALGAEAMAMAQIRRLARRGDGRTTLEGGWNGRPFLFPTGDAGTPPGLVRMRVSDATACFNLNSVVWGAAEQWRRYDPGVHQFRALLRALEVPAHRAEALVDALVDWIDSDQERGGAGAEDTDYGDYRTAGTLLGEASELRAIRGYDADTYARLRPHVCALPVAAVSPVNVNTLDDGDALILGMLTDNAVAPDVARRILATRPPGGWRDPEAFWAHPALVAAGVPEPVRRQVELRTRYFKLQAEVEHEGADVVLGALLEHDPAGGVRLLARRWTPEE
jgi:general secretion pathway protein K